MCNDVNRMPYECCMKVLAKKDGKWKKTADIVSMVM